MFIIQTIFIWTSLVIFCLSNAKTHNNTWPFQPSKLILVLPQPRLQTTWAFPLKCNLLLILLGLFLIVIVLCDFFWVNTKNQESCLFPLWAFKDITDEISPTETIYNSYHLVVRLQNLEGFGNTQGKSISSRNMLFWTVSREEETAIRFIHIYPSRYMIYGSEA